MKEFNFLSITCAALGGIFAAIFGGVDNLFIMLLAFMAIDYITGVLLAAVWKKSPKTETGALNSSVGFKGICKKHLKKKRADKKSFMILMKDLR